MKKIAILLVLICVLVSGCYNKSAANNTNADPITPSTTNQGDKNTSAKPTTSQNTDTKTPTGVATKPTETSTDASVEMLVKIAAAFLNAAYLNEVNEMASYCNDALKTKIESTPKTYVRTKPDYTIEKITTTITPLESSKYMLNLTVSALKKDDKTKAMNTFKYTMTVEKVKADYYIIDFK